MITNALTLVAFLAILEVSVTGPGEDIDLQPALVLATLGAALFRYLIS